MTSPRALFLPLAALSLAAFPAAAVEDSPPPDVTEMLKQLRTLKEQQTTQVKSVTARAFQEAQAAASNPARATELWEEAVRVTQFHGANKENAQFREWKEREGEAFKEREVQSALRLHFNWLAITLQRAGGAPVKDLLTAILAHTREAIVDQAAMEALEEAAKAEAPTPGTGARRPNNPRDREKRANEGAVRRLHDQIALRGLNSSVYVEWLRLADVIAEAGTMGKGKGAGKGGGGGASWEGVPGNIEGLFTNIIQPELLAQRDPRIVEYWDYLLRHEGEKASRTKLTFEIDKFNQIRRPQLIWNRHRDIAAIGLKNRAITDMFAHIKNFPTHPEVRTWTTELETLLAPTAPPAPPAP